MKRQRQRRRKAAPFGGRQRGAVEENTTCLSVCLSVCHVVFRKDSPGGEIKSGAGAGGKSLRDYDALRRQHRGGHDAGGNGPGVPGQASAAAAKCLAQNQGPLPGLFSFLTLFFFHFKAKISHTHAFACKASWARCSPAPGASCHRFSCPGELAKESFAACAGGNPPPALLVPRSPLAAQSCLFW